MPGFSAPQWAALALPLLFLLPPALLPSTRAADLPTANAQLGARLEPLLEAAQALSPAATAAGLSADAALSRAAGAGALPDPAVRAQYGEMNCMPGPVPMRTETCTQVSVEQEFTLWGKRGLAREIANAQASQAAAARDSVKLDLRAAVQQAFAAYYVAHEGARITDDIRRTVALAADVAQQRYAQALGPQQDVLALKVAVADLDTARTRREADRRRAAARLNTLLNRPAGAALAFPEDLPAAPGYDSLSLEALLARAAQGNPALKAQDAAVAMAAGARSLAEKSWYPDVTLGVSMMDQAHYAPAYAGMVSLKIPLNTTQRRAETSAATAEAGAARNRRTAAEAEIRGGLETGLLNLREAQEVADLLHRAHIPQADLAFRAALSGYGQGRAPLSAVLEAERHVLENQAEHLAALRDQQNAVADIERLVGGPL